MTLRRGVLVLLLSLAATLGVATAPAFGAYGFIQEWGSAGTDPGKFTDLRDVATDTNGNVFTLEATRIQKFSPERAFLTQAAVPPGDNDTSIAVKGAGATGIVYVVDREHGIRTYRASDLLPLGTVTLAGVPGTWAKPRAIAIDYLGNLIVSFPDDYGAGAPTISGIAMFQDTGAFIRTVGQYDTADATDDEKKRFVTPVDVAVDDQVGSDGQIYAVDSTKRRLFRWDRTTGDNPNTFTPAPATSWDPRAVAVMPLQPIFAPFLDTTSVLVGDQATAPPQDGRMWVTRGNGQFLGRFGTRGAGTEQYGLISGIAIDAFQRMFVADATQSKILEYGNGGTPGPGDPKDPDPPPNVNPTPTPKPIENTQPIICIGLWSAATCGSLPKPDPIYVCVSYWENCNGFGGSKPAKPGTIDMSGFPSSLSVDVGCSAESKKNPYTSRAVGDEVPAPDYVRPETECLLRGYLEGTLDKDQLEDRRAEVLWNIDARTFKGEVAAAYAQVIKGLSIVVAPFESNEDEWAAKIFLFSADYADKVFDEMAKPGVPFGGGVRGLSANAVCLNLETEDQFKRCSALITGYNESLRGQLTLLNFRKEQLFLHVSFEGYKKLIKKKMEDFEKKYKAKPLKQRAITSAAKLNVLKKRFVIGAGKLTIKPGKTGKLKIVISKGMRAHLKALKKAGVKSFKVRAVTEGSIVPGISGKRTKTVTISLVKVKKPKKKK